MTYAELIQPALWIVSIGTALVFVARAMAATRRRRQGAADARARPQLMRAAVALGVALLVVPAIGVVPPGHRGVVYGVHGGVSPGERGEGITFLAPWMQHLTRMSVRTQKVYSDKVFAQSLDLQEITVVASVNYHVQADQAAELYQRVGAGYQATVIQPALFQRTKAAIGQVRAEDFAARRGELAETIEAQLTEQLASYGIVVEFVNIEDAIFDPAFVQAVKEKVIAEQEAAEQERLIAAAAAVKEQTIIQAQATARSIQIEAEAQADANMMIARSLTPDMLRWRWLVTWNGAVPTTLVGSGDAALLLDGRSGSGGAWISSP